MRDGHQLMLAAAGLAAAAVLVGCGPPNPDTPGRFGEVTSAIVVVNPVINQGSSTSVASGSARGGIQVQAGDGPIAMTDGYGLALLEGFPTGTVPFKFSPGAVNVQVVQDKELYDVVVAVDQGRVEHILPPVRYPIGGQVVVLDPGADIGAAASSDGTVIILKAGTFPGGFDLRAANVLIFGAWSQKDGPLSTIEGNVTVSGGGNRLRGVKVTGTLTSNANGFSAAFCTLAGASVTGNAVSLLRNRFTQGQASVPSSSAVLVDNEGIP